jgi:hypothetical protein
MMTPMMIVLALLSPLPPIAPELPYLLLCLLSPSLPLLRTFPKLSFTLPDLMSLSLVIIFSSLTYYSSLLIPL